MKIPFLKKKEVEASEEDVHYIRLGSPNHPDNPIGGRPARPYAFTLIDNQGHEITEQWIRDQMARHADAGHYAADVLDEVISASASLAAASLKEQLMGEDGHLHIITQLKSREQDYFNGLHNIVEDKLDSLKKVCDLIKAQNA